MNNLEGGRITLDGIGIAVYDGLPIAGREELPLRFGEKVRFFLAKRSVLFSQSSLFQNHE